MEKIAGTKPTRISSMKMVKIRGYHIRIHTQAVSLYVNQIALTLTYLTQLAGTRE